MNERLAIITGAGIALAVLVAVAVFAGYQWRSAGCAADIANHNARVLAYQQALSDHQAEINRRAAQQAEAVATLNIAEQARQDAIEVSDEQSAQINNLKTQLAHIVERQQKSHAPPRGLENIDSADLIVVRGSYLNRLYTEIVRGGQQTPGPFAGTIQTRLSATARLDYGTDWPLADHGGRHWCDADKCCWAIQPLPEHLQRAMAQLRTTD